MATRARVWETSCRLATLFSHFERFVRKKSFLRLKNMFLYKFKTVTPPMKKRRQYYQPVDFKRLIKTLFKTARRQPVNAVIIRLTFRNFTLHIPNTRDETTSVLNFCKFILKSYFIRRYACALNSGKSFLSRQCTMIFRLVN